MSERIRSEKTASIVLVAATLALACGGDQPISRPPARTAILSRGAYDSLPALVLEPAGGLCDTATNCMLDHTGVAATGPQGAVAFTGFAKFQQLNRVSEQPRKLQALGRPGSGPGEYRSLLAIGFTPNGDVIAVDVLQQRLLRYSPDGRAISTSHVPMPPGFISAAFVGAELRVVATEAAKRKGDSVAVALFALDSGGRAPRRLVSFPVRQRSYALGDMIPVPRMFAAQSQWALSSDGMILFTSGETFAVDAFDSTGDPVMRFGFDVIPRAVTTEDIERRTAATLRRVGDPTMRSAIRAQWGHPASHHPAITRLQRLENGQTWIREAERAGGDSVRWVVFAPDGAPLGAVMMETETTVLASRDSLVLVCAPGEPATTGTLQWARLSAKPARR